MRPRDPVNVKKAKGARSSWIDSLLGPPPANWQNHCLYDHYRRSDWGYTISLTTIVSKYHTLTKTGLADIIPFLDSKQVSSDNIGGNVSVGWISIKNKTKRYPTYSIRFHRAISVSMLRCLTHELLWMRDQQISLGSGVIIRQFLWSSFSKHFFSVQGKRYCRGWVLVYFSTGPNNS